MVGFTGDGGSMYTIQALWTAARHDIAAKFVVCNNGSYRLLQLNIDQYWQERGIDSAPATRARSTSSTPEIDFVELARGLGVEAVRVEKPGRGEPPPWTVACSPAMRRSCVDLDHP